MEETENCEKQPTVAGHSGKLEMKVTFLPRFYAETLEGHTEHSPLQQLEAHLLVGISLLQSKGPVGSAAFLSSAWKGRCENCS